MMLQVRRQKDVDLRFAKKLYHSFRLNNDISKNSIKNKMIAMVKLDLKR